MPEYQIDLDTGKAWTQAWREKNPDMVRAFRVDVEEIHQILATSRTTYVRVYMGYDEVEKTEKLVLVPVDENGNDIIETEAGKNSNLYDFTLPCPSICDVNSPLNS